MTTRLDELLESIDPARTIDMVSADVDRAVNSFKIGQVLIDDWEKYETVLTDFVWHVDKAVLRQGPGAPLDRDILWARCSNMLKKAYGASGYKAAFEMVSTGKDGGLYGVLRTLAEQLAEDYAQKEVAGRIWHFLEPLGSAETLAAADEYVKKYGHLLPTEFTAGNAARLKAHFQGVLEEHARMISRMRRVGR